MLKGWALKLVEWRLSRLVKLAWLVAFLCSIPWALLKVSTMAVIELFGDLHAEWRMLGSIIRREESRLDAKSQVTQ